MINPVKRLNPPLPRAVLHLRLGDSLDSAKYLDLAQLVSRGPVGVKAAAHVADFVRPLLKWRNSVADVSPQEVVARQAILDKGLDLLMDHFQLGVLVPRVEVLVGLRVRGAKDELRQPDLVFVGRVLHVEE